MAGARPRGSRAVESFLRNFEGERGCYAQVLEVALVYGVFCLAQNFSLRHISLAELLAVTDYEKINKRDYFVRKGAQTPAPRQQAEPEASARILLRPKPSHKWRDGAAKAVDDEFASHLPTDGLHGPAEAKEEVAMPQPATAAVLLEHDTPVDAIDLYSRVLGKHFMDTAWTVFTGRSGSRIADRVALDELCIRIDQRKKPHAFPTVELPIASFSEFLDAYVGLCVSGFQSQREVEPVQDDATETETGVKARDGTRNLSSLANLPSASGINDRDQQHTKSTTELMNNEFTSKPKRKPTFKPPREPRPLPRHLQHVQSKIQPELSSRRDKVLRIKKTQTQLMKESLARTRLAEYEARKHLDDARDRAMLKKRAPLEDITQGAAALEIVDSFVRSPLMDTFGKEPFTTPSLNVTQAIGKASDPVQEELYGAAALDDSFVGVKVPKACGAAARLKRGFNGWLGDFGPAHTKTVRHEWSDGEDSADERDAGEQTAPRFEWNFDNVTLGPDTQRDNARVSIASSRSKAIRTLDESLQSDFLVNDHDHLSQSSNSVYEWLKEAV